MRADVAGTAGEEYAHGSDGIAACLTGLRAPADARTARSIRPSLRISAGKGLFLLNGFAAVTAVGSVSRA